MDWSAYREIVDEKIRHAWYEFEAAEKKYLETKATYDARARELKEFLKFLEELERDKV